MHGFGKTVSVTQAVRDFAGLIDKIRYENISITLTKGNRDVASLSPVESRPCMNCGELLQLLQSHDLLDEAEKKSFSNDLKQSRKTFKKQSNPWPS